MLSIFTILSFFIKYLLAYDIAIIGGGIGGASSAYFLKQFQSNNVNIDLFEGNKIGGRLATAYYKGNYYETGGSIIHEKNFYMNHFLEILGFEKSYGCPNTFGVFNGNQMIFKSSEYDFITIFKLWWRYGREIFHMGDYIDETIDQFSRIYEQGESKFYPVYTTNELLSLIGTDLLDSINISSSIGFALKGYSKKIIEEIIAPIIRCNYCQSTDIHLFVGSVAIAGAGTSLWSVKQGNYKIAEGLIKKSNTNLINLPVTSISFDKLTSKLTLTTDLFMKTYDYVIIATPILPSTNLKFYGFSRQPDFENYHKVFCTLIEGEVNRKFFITKGDSLPEILLFASKYLLNAMAKIDSVDDDCQSNVTIWKIFSDEEITELDLKLLFIKYIIIYKKEWLAYPEYDNIGINKSFYLFNNNINVYYINAIESLASAMEMSAVGAHNVAALINKDIKMKKNSSLIKKFGDEL